MRTGNILTARRSQLGRGAHKEGGDALRIAAWSSDAVILRGESPAPVEITNSDRAAREKFRKILAACKRACSLKSHAKILTFAGLQRVQLPVADPAADQAQGGKANRRGHPPYLPVAPLRQRQ